MKCVLSILLGVFLAGTAAANPIRNSSFELDSANFGVVRFARSGDTPLSCNDFCLADNPFS